jgi:hypothetical protein
MGQSHGKSVNGADIDQDFRVVSPEAGRDKWCKLAFLSAAELIKTLLDVS